MVLDNLSQGHVERLNSISSVDGFANFGWEGKKWNDAFVASG